MMVLEMAGASKNHEVGRVNKSESHFTDWIYEHLERGEDLGIEGVTTEEEEVTSRKMVLVSLWCIQTNPADRPSMSNVVEMLEGSLQSLQIPPKPILFSPARQPVNFSTTLSSTWDENKDLHSAGQEYE
ncbi:unnamed protein product [Ilex paraguariensis]|uniref:Uncharacterized protein n=1 Tax=Ilex paraguariensis TaxID=185542 RepID=A0ABC8S354_9AQUA